MEFLRIALGNKFIIISCFHVNCEHMQSQCLELRLNAFHDDTHKIINILFHLIARYLVWMRCEDMKSWYFCDTNFVAANNEYIFKFDWNCIITLLAPTFKWSVAADKKSLYGNRKLVKFYITGKFSVHQLNENTKINIV